MYWIQAIVALARSLYHPFFFSHTATTEIYTLSLHVALPIFPSSERSTRTCTISEGAVATSPAKTSRSEEHTSELQSPCNLVCRLLLEKKKQAACSNNSIHSSVLDCSADKTSLTPTFRSAAPD